MIRPRRARAIALTATVIAILGGVPAAGPVFAQGDGGKSTIMSWAGDLRPEQDEITVYVPTEITDATDGMRVIRLIPEKRRLDLLPKPPFPAEEEMLDSDNDRRQLYLFRIRFTDAAGNSVVVLVGRERVRPRGIELTETAGSRQTQRKRDERMLGLEN